MVLILQNVACEGPGTIASYLSSHDLAFRTARLFEGTGVAPNLDGVSHLIVLGGSMSVHDEGRFPFLGTESRLIEEAILKDVPTLGICLGAQLIAKVLGAKVVKAPLAPVGRQSHPTKGVRPGELGWYNVQLTKQGQKDPLFRGAGKELRVFQWHEDTFDIPRGAVLLGRSETCRNQAFRHEKNVYALQFHVEADGAMIGDWFDTYEPENRLREGILSEYKKIADAYHRQANVLFDNFFLG
jgi:GMP synthase (glutamine-hydrolysing)